MDEPLKLFELAPNNAPGSPPSVDSEASQLRSQLLGRLLALLAAGTVAFALTAWWLVRIGDSPSLLEVPAQPATVVRRQLTALNRGDLRAAYELFSQQYRQQVSFEAFHELVVTHWAMFHTREVRFLDRQRSADRAVLETHLVTTHGGRYIAEFTLRRVEGRWWIDDVRWGRERTRGKLLTV